MKRTTVVLVAIALGVMGPAFALWSVSDKGTWPPSWPEELEPLRKQSRSLTGGQINLTFHEIPFTQREDFEAAWPHLLKVKSKGAPLILLRGPDQKLGSLNAGVRIRCPPPQKGNRGTPDTPEDTIPASELPEWARTHIELVVDGDIVDLNRIPLPADTPIIDKRFDKPRPRAGG